MLTYPFACHQKTRTPEVNPQEMERLSLTKRWMMIVSSETIDFLKIDESIFLHLNSYTRIIMRNTGFFHQESEEEAARKLRADERKRAHDAEKAKAISTTREPANRVGTLQSQNQSAPNRRVEKGTISPVFVLA